jgi:hypothetical protein
VDEVGTGCQTLATGISLRFQAGRSPSLGLPAGTGKGKPWAP